MGIEALKTADDGTIRFPHSEPDWSEWVTATGLRSYALGDPLIDWLNTYGRTHGFVPDTERPGYDWRTDFSLFLYEKATHFEQSVLEYLKSCADIAVISTSDTQTRD